MDLGVHVAPHPWSLRLELRPLVRRLSPVNDPGSGPPLSARYSNTATILDKLPTSKPHMSGHS